MRVAYFVHDLSDPAVAKRVSMLRAGGAEPILLGFTRSDEVPAQVAGARAICLGRTYDADFKQRCIAIMRAAMSARRHAMALGEIDVCLARNLEMLAVARAFRARRVMKARIVYECLDVHRLLLRSDGVGRALRAIEAALLKSCRLLIVSSPAFWRSYFLAAHGERLADELPLLIVENKVFAGDATGFDGQRPAPGAHRPWRIGWFGAIRCRRSLRILQDLARRRPDLLEVVIRGRPSPAEFDDLAADLADIPNARFAGPYTADDLAAIYADVHFTWAVDYFEAGGNSDWLLPNRIYEGGLHGVPALASRRVQTGAWLAEHGLGVLMDDPEKDLEATLEAMTPEHYQTLVARARSAPKRLFVADAADCVDLNRALAEAA